MPHVHAGHTGWSQMELARRAHLPSVPMSQLERGGTKAMLPNTLRAFCAALGVSGDYRIGLIDEERGYE